MGIGDFTTKILSTYKADVSDHKAKLKDLQGEEKKLAQEQLNAAQARNKQWDDWQKGLAKIGVAIAGVSALYMIGRSGFREYAEDVKLRAAAAGVNIDRLKDATKGLVNTDNLLMLAAKLNRKELGITQGQMELAAKAALSLSRQGHDLETTLNDVTEALVKGQGRGLKQYGLRVEEMGSAAGNTSAILTALAEEAVKAESSVVSGTQAQVEALQRLGIEWDNFTDDIKESIGSVVVEIAALARKAGRGAYGAAAGGGGFFGDLLGGVTGVPLGAISGLKTPDQIDAEETARAANEAAESAAGAWVARFAESWNLGAIKEVEKAKKAKKAGRRGGGGSRRGLEAFDPSLIDIDPTSVASIGELPELGGMTQLREFQAQQLLAKRGGDPEGPLKNIFGSLEAMEAYTSAIGALSSAMGGAFSAWVDGSLSAGQAIKKFFGDAIKGIANEMFVRALSHGAAALGALATYNYPAAALHGKAAAAYAAGAIVAGGLARQMGGGGGPSGGGGPTASAGALSPSGGGGRGDQGGSNAVIVVGDSFSDDSPLMRSRRARRLFIKAGLGGNTVEHR
jgi:hypothetical protein